MGPHPQPLSWPIRVRRPAGLVDAALPCLPDRCKGAGRSDAAAVAGQRLREGGGDAGFRTAKVHTARFCADHVLGRASGLAHAVVHGADAALAIDEAQL